MCQNLDIFHDYLTSSTLRCSIKSNGDRKLPKLSKYRLLKNNSIGYISRDRAENSEIKSPVNQRDRIDRFCVIDELKLLDWANECAAL